MQTAAEPRLRGALPYHHIDQYGFTVFEHGAHVASWTRANGDPVLFMSGISHFEPEKPIRGGIPICFPWFGPRVADPGAPAHGFARTRAWKFAGSIAEAGKMGLAFTLQSDEATRAIWPFDFQAHYAALVGDDSLTLRFTVRLLGESAALLEAVLHTYFAVKDVREISISGLEGALFMDKLTGTSQSEAGPIRFEGETDRVYNATSGHFVIEDPQWKRRILISTDAPSTVVWNPWIEKAHRLTDFGDDEWPGMVCLESGFIGEDQPELKPGEELTFSVSYRVEDL